MTSVFNPDGTYKETYRKELNKFQKYNFHGYVCRDKSKEKYLIHKSYDEFVDFEEEFKNLKTINKQGNNNMAKGRPPKTTNQPNKETLEAMKEAVNGETNKYETINDIFDEAKKEIIVDNIQSEVKFTSKPTVKNTISYKFKDLESLKGLNELVVLLSFFTKRLHDNNIININSEELKILERDTTNPNQTYLLILKIIINRFLEKGILDFTNEEYTNIPNKYKEFLLS
jgi:rubrerythrin